MRNKTKGKTKTPEPQYTYIIKVYSKDNTKVINDLTELSSFVFSSKILSLHFLRNLVDFVIKQKK